jgi:hypothetical protein
MEKTTNEISIIELKRLLVTIVDYNLPVAIRYRFMGEMWQPNFMKVIKVREVGILFQDQTSGRLTVIPDLNRLIQFELDGRIHNYEPHNHYNVTTKELSL